MRIVTIGIIGFGPRGLTFIDRFIDLFRHVNPAWRVDFHIIEPGELGEGVHCRNSPFYLYTNTPCGAINFYPNTCIAAAPAKSGPSLGQWARSQGYRMIEERCEILDCSLGRMIQDDEFLPRHILGKYLHWFFKTIRVDLPNHISIVHHATNAHSLDFNSIGIVDVVLQSGVKLSLNHAVLCTGHRTEGMEGELRDRYPVHVRKKQDQRGTRYLSSPYPIDRLAQIRPEDAVAVRGFGPTAFDIVSSLTVGRGGRFDRSSSTLRYLTSGLEPKIALFSRSGMPFRTRPKTALKSFAAIDVPLIESMRTTLVDISIAWDSSRKIDFEEDILPVIIAEMGRIYKKVSSVSSYLNFVDLDYMECCNIVRQALLKEVPKDITSLNGYRKFFVNFIREDIIEAEQGLATSALKAASEVIRHARSLLRLVVENKMITPESHKKFVEYYHPAMQRFTYGVTIARNLELLALIDSGVVDVLGSLETDKTRHAGDEKVKILSKFRTEAEQAFEVDYVIGCPSASLIVGNESPPLYQSLFKNGIISPNKNEGYSTGGISINKSGNPIDYSGRSNLNIWINGLPTEGSKYFTYVLPSSMIASEHVLATDQIVIGIFSHENDRLSREEAGRSWT